MISDGTIKVAQVTADQHFVRVNANGVITGAGRTDALAYIMMEAEPDGSSLRAVATDHKDKLGWKFDDATWTASKRPAFAFNKTTVKADGIDAASIANLDAGTHVWVMGPDGLMVDTVTNSVGLELSFTVPGTYFVTLDVSSQNSATTTYTIGVTE